VDSERQLAVYFRQNVTSFWDIRQLCVHNKADEELRRQISYFIHRGYLLCVLGRRVLCGSEVENFLALN